MWHENIPEPSLDPPDLLEREDTRCPVCGGLCEEFYKNKNNDIIGCECCIKRVDAWEEEI